MKMAAILNVGFQWTHKRFATESDALYVKKHTQLNPTKVDIYGAHEKQY